MMILCCEDCKTEQAILLKGSKIRSGTVVLCEKCNDKRKAKDLARGDIGSEQWSIMSRIFGV